MANNKKITRGEAPPTALTQEVVSGLSLWPLAFRLAKREALSSSRKPGAGWDAVLEAVLETDSPPLGSSTSSASSATTFIAEYKRQWTPQQVRLAVGQARDYARQAGQGILPLVVVPYLSEERLRELEKEAISGIDLCGNGFVILPGRLVVYRTGNPNRFKSSAPLKNIYRGVSSLVARTFLANPVYPTVNALYAEVKQRGADISLATVSKVVQGLEEDLIVGRTGGGLRLLQPDKLLDKLVLNYRAPEINRFFVGKVDMERPALLATLQQRADTEKLGLVATGVGSVWRYATMAMEETLSVYCTSRDTLLRDLPATATHHFPNLEIIETADPTVYFDPQLEMNCFPWAAPLQSYLEMTIGEERLRQSVAPVRKLLLDAAREKGAGTMGQIERGGKLL